MKESDMENPASYHVHESCGGRSNAPVEALTGRNAGTVLSLENGYNRVSTQFKENE